MTRRIALVPLLLLSSCGGSFLYNADRDEASGKIRRSALFSAAAAGDTGKLQEALTFVPATSTD